VTTLTSPSEFTPSTLSRLPILDILSCLLQGSRIEQCILQYCHPVSDVTQVLNLDFPARSPTWILNGCTFFLRQSLHCKAPLASFLEFQSGIVELTLRGFQNVKTPAVPQSIQHSQPRNMILSLSLHICAQARLVTVHDSSTPLFNTVHAGSPSFARLRTDVECERCLCRYSLYVTGCADLDIRRYVSIGLALLSRPRFARYAKSKRN